jgi:hypothetical protein
MGALSDAVLDELAAAVVGSPRRLDVRSDPIARPETAQQPGTSLTKLAATLIVAGSWGYRARSRGVASRGPEGRVIGGNPNDN